MATSFHGFAVKEKIGAGGMSTVYKGTHETLGYPVAIKVLHPGMAGDQSFIARFEREAKAASALRNNNIASVIDFGSENDIYFIVMEFIDGKDTGQIFKELQDEGAEPKAMPIEISLALLEEVAYGLRDAHELGIIHRDVKPSNILLSKRGEVKIADFGLARDTSDMASMSDQDLTMPGTVVGTPSYMSPEQAAGTELDVRSDIFSLGVMAYQLVMGEKPFKGATPTEVQERIINDDPPQLSQERCPLLTEEISHLIFKMLAKDPGRRYQSMDQVLRAMSDCMESVDTSGSLIKYKRDYLARFAKDPREFSDELKRKGISNHLKRGYHFKKMGLTNIDDALREFSYVLSLDPANEKAQEAINELKHEAEASGIVPAYEPPGVFDAGKTQVMPSAPRAGAGSDSPASDPHATAERPAPPAPPKTGKGAKADKGGKTGKADKPQKERPRPPKPQPGGGDSPARNPLVLYGGIGAAVVLVVVLLIVFWPGGGDEATRPDGTQVAQTEVPAQESPGQSDGKPDASSQSGTPAVKDGEIPAVEVADAGGTEPEEVADPVAATSPGPGTEAQAEAEEPAPPTGTIAITSTPDGVVYIKRNERDTFRRLGATPMTTDPLETGRWELRVEKSGYQGQSKVVALEEGEKQVLEFRLVKPTPRPEPEPVATGPGWFRLVISPFGDIFLDGNQVATGRRVAVIQADAGRSHTIRIHHPPTVGDIVLKDLKATPGDTVGLGRQFFDVGTLRVAANFPCGLQVDGKTVDGQTPLAVDRLLVGRRDLVAVKEGYVVDKLWQVGAGGSRIEIRPVDANATPRKYRVTIGSGETLRVKFELKSVDDQ